MNIDSTLDESTVRYVASLARLDISDDEVALYVVQLSKILRYVEQLNELDTSRVEPTSHPLPVTNVLRDDAVRKSFDPDRALGNAPERQDSFFRVPKVLDQEST